MASSIEHVRALLSAHLGAATGAMTLAPVASEGNEQRFVARDSTSALDIHLYPASDRETALREEAGLRLGGDVGLAPALIYAGEVDAHSGLWLNVAQAARGVALGREKLSEAEVDGWLFLLLTLHHLRPEMTSQASSMSADPHAWWARIAPSWETCRAAYAQPQFAALARGLSQLHAITQVRIETNRGLWQGIARRPCHGNPAPGRLVKDGAKMTLTEWSGFGLGDPAIEVARVAALAALSGELSSAQYTRFIAAYQVGMRDLHDATLEERLRIFASVAPVGFALTALAALAQPGVIPPPARRELLEQVSRALTWSQESIGVAIGDPSALLAPLR